MKDFPLVRSACLCIVSVLVCMSLSPAAQNKNYRNSAAGYELEYPADFTVKNIGSATVFSSRVEDKKYAFSPSVNVVAVDLGGSVSDLDVFYRQSKEALGRSLGTVKFIEDKKDTLSKTDAYRLVYASRQKKADFKFLQVLCVHNNRAYVLTYTALQDQYDKFLKVAQAMIKSFRFIKK